MSVIWLFSARMCFVSLNTQIIKKAAMMPNSSNQRVLPRQNKLLASLPGEIQQRIFPDLEPLNLPRGHVLDESGETLDYVYFPTTAIVTLLYVMENGATTEISLVGNEGMIGICSFMGSQATFSRAVVQCAGGFFRLKSELLLAEFNQHGEMMQLLLRYTLSLITQMSQTAVCNRHHTIDQQLCRFLLLSFDRLPNRCLMMTQELIASMLGVRREGVTEAAGKLQRLGVIEYRRGHIMVLDRAKLERLSCECYAVVKHETDRLLPKSAFLIKDPQLDKKAKELS